MMKRVVITGMGLVTPLGIGRKTVAQNLVAGECGISPIERFDTASLGCHLGGEVRDFSPMDFISPRTFRRMDRLSQMVTAAARMTVEDAGVDLTAVDRTRIGIVMGTAYGATDVATQFAGTLFTEGPRRVNPILVPNTVMNAPAGHAAIELGLKGINSTVNHREASAETALAYAAMQIRLGRADVILAGGGDTISPFFITVLERFRALSPQGGGEEMARPFDRNRNGPVIGEGAALLCLESLDSALERGARIYGEIAGWGMASAPAPVNDWPDDPAGMILAMQKAMTMAAVSPAEIDAVFAAASGGVRSDRLEARALDHIFGQVGQPSRPVVTAIKGALGENFASGGIRSAALALAMHGGMVPPTLGLASSILTLDVVTSKARKMDVCYGLINGCASSGTFVSLLLRKM